ncbi:MAG: hypothetical protein JW843_03250 [Candidatus Aminicenantes bacterium]|nr:hypothetical protein [Candidatus Aminicenantes bacterium]
MPSDPSEKAKRPRTRDKTGHRAALLAGLGLFLVFFGLTQTHTGLKITFHRPFTSASPGELFFWLGFCLLLVPGALLVGYGLSPASAPKIQKSWYRFQALDRRQKAFALILIFVLAAFSARVSHRLVLNDFPISDDEYATRFGGQVLASGRVTAPEPEPFHAYSTLFLFHRNQTVTSVDWPGPLAAWAISESTGTGPLIFSLSAALAAAALAALGAILFSPAYGLAAFLLFFFSPMAFLLSATTHAHVLSRGAIALTILFFILAKRKSSPFLWAATGFLAAGAFACRPVETTALLFPLLADFAAGAVRAKGPNRRPLVYFVLGAILPLALFALYNGLITGNPAVPPRFFMEGPGDTIAGESLWNRLGANSGYNLVMLAVWFLGPLGVAAVIFGAGRNRLTRLLSLGVALNLLAGLLHDNHGLHIVGPIHYSECAVPLTIIALAGLITIKDKLGRAGLAAPVFAAMVASTLVFGMGTFIAWHGGALKAQARIQSELYGRIEETLESRGTAGAVVIAPRFADVWRAIPEFNERGTWVFEWRRARPDLSDRYLIVQDVPDAVEIFRKKFPGRPVFRLSVGSRPPYVTLAPADL